MTPDLTLSYGVRYSWYSVPYEINGKESIQNFTFNDYFDKRLQQSAAGLSGDTTLPFIAYSLGGKANHAPGYYQSNPEEFRAPAGVCVQSQLRQEVGDLGRRRHRVRPHRGQRRSVPAGPVLLPVPKHRQSALWRSIGPGGLAPDRSTVFLHHLHPDATRGPVITHPYEPFVDADGVPFGLANSRAFNETIDPKLKNPYSIVIDFGIQHEFPRNYILKVNYAGRLGRRLLAQADANQLIDFPDKASGQMMSTAFAHITQEVRAGADTTNLPAEPWFEDVVLPASARPLATRTTPRWWRITAP